MRELPSIRRSDGVWQFWVDGAPFLALGGELHNSSASDPAYMEEKVWPAVEQVGVNFLLVPAYWELLEPAEGVFDFSYLDRIMDQAHARSIRLGLLWFGMWKGPDSLYIPLWLKARLRDEDFQRGEDGRLLRQISPFSEQVFAADKRAYQELCRHLKEEDADRQTVILLQVENEPGTWFHRRDFSAGARKAFAEAVPPEIGEEYRVSGSWGEAFGQARTGTAQGEPGAGQDADDRFMNWIYAKRIQELAESGKAIYPLPTFTNCVPSMGFLKVAGGPSADHGAFWKKYAPAIDVLTPNVYDPDFERVIDPYQREDNPLMIPENDAGIDCAGRALYAAGRGALMYSPFGIEDFFRQPLWEWGTAAPDNAGEPEGGPALRDAYAILRELGPLIPEGLKKGKLYSVYQRPEEKTNLPVPGFGGMVSMKDGDVRTIRMEPYLFDFHFGYTPDREKAPRGAALLLETGENEFLFAAVNGCLTIRAAEEKDSVFVDDLREYVVRKGKPLPGRILNGDERNTIAAGRMPALFSIRLSLHR